jgi:hypothetical protein
MQANYTDGLIGGFTFNTNLMTSKARNEIGPHFSHKKKVKIMTQNKKWQCYDTTTQLANYCRL